MVRPLINHSVLPYQNYHMKSAVTILRWFLHDHGFLSTFLADYLAENISGMGRKHSRLCSDRTTSTNITSDETIISAITDTTTILEPQTIVTTIVSKETSFSTNIVRTPGTGSHHDCDYTS